MEKSVISVKKSWGFFKCKNGIFVSFKLFSGVNIDYFFFAIFETAKIVFLYLCKCQKICITSNTKINVFWNFFITWGTLHSKIFKNIDFSLWGKVHFTIQKFFLIWISRSFKTGASNKTISYFNQFFRFSGLWLIWAKDLGRSGQNKSWRTDRTNNYFLKILNSDCPKKNPNFSTI